MGIWNRQALWDFVIIPLSIYLILGLVFLFTGFISLLRIRTIMKHDGTKTDKLEKLMIRICIFSVLYTVPAVLVIVCYLYEFVYIDYWMLTWHVDMCSGTSSVSSLSKPMTSSYNNIYSIPCPMGDKRRHVGRKPQFQVFMLKYLMTLIVGITSSFWIWSPKTLTSWKEFFYKLKPNSTQPSRNEAYV